MPKRCIGEAQVVIRPTGVKYEHGWHGGKRCVYAGEILVGRHRWPFKDLSVPSFHPCHFESQIDQAASEAVGFATSQTSENRSEEDLPEWAPPAAVADAIERATSFAQDDSRPAWAGEYRMRRGICPRRGRR